MLWSGSIPPANLPEPGEFADSRLQALYRDIRTRTLVMGILNTTPDSFYDGGKAITLDLAHSRAMKMVQEGADIIDVGGESTRPGAESVSVEEELERTISIIRKIRDSCDVAISIDTTKPEVAEEAIKAGACMVNDISGLTFSASLAGVAAAAGIPLVIMHIRGTPRTMQEDPRYDDLVGDILEFFDEQVAVAELHGLEKRHIILDPGFGFGKTVRHNLEMLRRLDEFRKPGLPLLIGTSRKSTLGAVLGGVPVEERLMPTAASVALGAAAGANIVRVHDVLEMKRTVTTVDAIINKSGSV